MRVIGTGASGFIGSALVSDLIAAGHQVVGLARSNASAAALTAASAEVRRGTVEDLDSLRAGAGTLGLASLGRVATEQDASDPSASPWNVGTRAALALAERGVRSSVVRLAPTVHDQSKRGLVGQLVDIAREKGVSGYLGDGSNRWPTVHQLDAARLFRLALEKAPAGSVLHGVGEEGVTIRAIAEVIGRHLDVPVTAVAAEDAGAHFGFAARFLGLDNPTSNALTRELLGWQPTHPGLIDDLDNGQFFDS
ncbi:NAD-dependent epimerase/dehydratase family protein [Actinacidiphila soli]|uniref:NAD-dependent epimerase/dehydratase family protein n=1 Tax=Actinacidiphila soli TaxID=2487275 RepID=UPI000FCBAB3D|nr:NAD-dependent epimerase/dehydratase family protein [Actinacidiphila soli]